MSRNPRMVVKHSVFNLVGLGAPLLVAVVTIPMLVHGLGTDRFGLLTLMWAVVSYFGVFDLGLGRALTQQIASAMASGQQREVGTMVGTATWLLAALGAVAGLALAALAGWGVDRLHTVTDRSEAVAAVVAMAFAMPAVTLTSGWRGVLEAQHAFGTINLIRLPMGLFTFLGPLAVVVWAGPRLDWIAWTLAGGRVVGAAVHAFYARRCFPPEAGPWRWEARQVRPLGAAGGWLTVSNVVSPLLGYVDRFLIGGTISAAAVAHYTVPNELITKLWIIPTALTSVLFPAIAERYATDPASLRPTMRRAVLGIAAVMLPVCLAIGLLARPLLARWIGNDFAGDSHVVLQILAFGMFVSSVATVPFTALQGVGKARITASIHLLELPVFVGIIYFFTMRFGVVGAAVAWSLRVCLDTLLMFASYRQVERHESRPAAARLASP